VRSQIFVHNGREKGEMPVKSLSAALIWNTLSKINVNEFTEEKGGLTYLSWSHAWRIMMENYPEMSIKWQGTTDENGVTRDVTYYEGGTTMVNCSVTIGEVKRECWLPVMDYRMKSISHPSSRDISDAKMRCMVKCFSFYGLANYIYSGDALPEDVTDVTDVTPPKQKTKKRKKAAKKKEAETNGVPSEEELAIVEAVPTDLALEIKHICHELDKAGWEPDEKLKKDLKAAVAKGDQKKMEKHHAVLSGIKSSLLALSDGTEEQGDTVDV